MTKANVRHYTMKSQLKLLAILTALVLAAACSKAPTTPPELKELAERAAIEDLFHDYYSQFGPTSQHNFMSYFAANGRLEVNGLVANGFDEIKAMYAQAGVGSEGKAPKAEGAVPEGVSEMMYTNLRIHLQGDSLVKELLSEDKVFCDLFLGTAELRRLADC